ncbi:MAG: hypothetical protein WA580_05425, partial [Acidimicrobiales bacterium]
MLYGLGETAGMLAEKSALSFPVEESATKLSLGRSPVVLHDGILYPSKSVTMVSQSPCEIDIF